MPFGLISVTLWGQNPWYHGDDPGGVTDIRKGSESLSPTLKGSQGHLHSERPSVRTPSIKTTLSTIMDRKGFHDHPVIRSLSKS